THEVFSLQTFPTASSLGTGKLKSLISLNSAVLNLSMEKNLLGILLVTSSSRGHSLPFRYPESIFDSQRSSKDLRDFKIPTRKPRTSNPRNLPEYNVSELDLNNNPVSEFINSQSRKTSFESKHESRTGSLISLDKLSNDQLNNDSVESEKSFIPQDSLGTEDELNEAFKTEADISSEHKGNSLLETNSFESQEKYSHERKVSQTVTYRNIRKFRQSKSVFQQKAKKASFPSESDLKLHHDDSSVFKTKNTQPESDHNSSCALDSSVLKLDSNETDFSSKNTSEYTTPKVDTVTTKPLPESFVDPSPYLAKQSHSQITQEKLDSTPSNFNIAYNNALEDDKSKFSLNNPDLHSNYINVNITTNSLSSGLVSFRKQNRTLENRKDNNSLDYSKVYNQNQTKKRQVSYTTSLIYGFDPKLLAQILSSRSTKSSHFFLVGIDQFSFLSHTPSDSSTFLVNGKQTADSYKPSAFSNSDVNDSFS
ncbi:hypothetical protein BB560_003756, partial [Smittium megazygosporum]